MKVIYDLQAYSFGPYGGIVRMFDETISRLAKKEGYKACLYAPSRLSAQPPSAPNVKLSIWSGLPRPLQSHQIIRRGYNFVSKYYWKLQKGDIFHPTFYPTFYPNAPYLLQLKTVVNIYDLTHEKFECPDDMPDQESFKQLKRLVIEKASRIICISEAVKNDFLEYYANIPPDIIRVVRLGYNPLFRIMNPDEVSQTAASLLKTINKPFILYVGSRQRYKNFHRFISAYRRWHKNKDLDVVIVGGMKKSWDGVVDDITGSTGKLRFVGYLDDNQLCALYNKAAFFAFPSLNEGFGIPLLEAMASNCPVCASDTPSFREIAGEAARFFDPYSIDSMIDSFDKCLNDRDNQKMKSLRLEQVKKFSWDKCAEQIWEIYKELT